MNHSFEKESTRAVPAIEYRKVFKRFERTDAKREHIRRGRKDSPSEDSASGIASSGQEDGFYAVRDLSATIRDGELITILGSSGCGKTTLLKMTNRLYEPDGGSILLFGEDIQKQDPVQLRRRMGYVIQQAGLFPHMTVEDNISVIPRLLKWESSRCRDRVTELLDLVGLDPNQYRSRYPSQLSGGQQQRVGLARALATRPRIMLLDEPFGAVDAITRLNLQNELLRIHRETGGTFLFITHDIHEAFRLGNRVMIMNGGRLLQMDTPETIVRNPADPFVETLIRSAMEQERFWNNTSTPRE
jgi:osmoprotectant transport system ATP-binding protein